MADSERKTLRSLSATKPNSEMTIKMAGHFLVLISSKLILPKGVQYKSLSALSDKAQNRLKGGFYDGPDLTTVK